MAAPVLQPEHCPRTGIEFVVSQPGDTGSCEGMVCFINGIGLDHHGFHDALTAVELPLNLQRHPYGGWRHVAFTVPGFEDAIHRLKSPILGMGDQVLQVVDFLEEQVRAHGVESVVLYGFSFGSDLVVDLLDALAARMGFPLRRVVLTEMNVRRESCFITRRISESYEAAQDLGHGRHQQAYAGFVSSIMRAYTEGHLDHALMQDMTVYFRTIAKKDWHQLARSAREVSSDPRARACKLLQGLPRWIDVDFDLVFSDPGDFQAMQGLIQEVGASAACIQMHAASAYGHFNHMGRQGVMENLRRGWRHTRS